MEDGRLGPPTALRPGRSSGGSPQTAGGEDRGEERGEEREERRRTEEKSRIEERRREKKRRREERGVKRWTEEKIMMMFFPTVTS